MIPGHRRALLLPEVYRGVDVLLVTFQGLACEDRESGKRFAAVRPSGGLPVSEGRILMGVWRSRLVVALVVGRLRSPYGS